MNYSLDAVPTQEEEQQFWQGYQHRRAAAAAGWSKPVAKPAAQSKQNRLDDAARLTLFTGHISPQAEYLRGDDREWAGQVEVWKDGSIAKVTVDTTYRPTDDYRHEDRPHLDSVKGVQRGGGIRGKVDAKFSRKARLRMLRDTGKLDNRTRPYFVTLTFRDEVYTGIGDAKKAVDKVRKALERRWPNMGALWRMELAKRLSGAREGEYVPHFHLLIWPNIKGEKYDTGKVKRKKNVIGFKCKPGFLLTTKQYKKFQRFVNETWGTVTTGIGKNDVTAVYDNRGVSAYVSKYVAKIDEESADDTAYPEDVGRLWGKWNEENIPVSEIVSIPVSSVQARRIMSRFRHWMGMDDSDIPWGPSLHCHLSPAWFFEKLDDLLSLDAFAEEAQNGRERAKRQDELYQVRSDEEMAAFRAKLDVHIANGSGSRFVM